MTYYKKKPIVRDGKARNEFLHKRYKEIADQLYDEETKCIELSKKLQAIKDQKERRKEENPVAYQAMNFREKEKHLNSRIRAEYHERQVLENKIAAASQKLQVVMRVQIERTK